MNVIILKQSKIIESLSLKELHEALAMLGKPAVDNLLGARLILTNTLIDLNLRLIKTETGLIIVNAN